MDFMYYWGLIFKRWRKIKGEIFKRGGLLLDGSSQGEALPNKGVQPTPVSGCG